MNETALEATARSQAQFLLYENTRKKVAHVWNSELGEGINKIHEILGSEVSPLLSYDYFLYFRSDGKNEGTVRAGKVKFGNSADSKTCAICIKHWKLLRANNFWQKEIMKNVHHKHQGLDPLIRSVSKVTTALSNVSSVFHLFSFLVVCSSMISKGLGFVAFFASVETSSVCIQLSCPVCL